jgi:hypothetical protein
MESPKEKPKNRDNESPSDASTKATSSHWLHSLSPFATDEWPVVKDAPVTFLIAVLLTTLIFILGSWYFELLVPSYVTSSLRAQNQILTSQIEALRNGSLPQKNEEGFWSELTGVERQRLLAQLTSIDEFEVVISCGEISCRAFAKSLSEVFQEAKWRHVRISLSGGESLAMEGLGIYPDDEKAKKLKESLESSTGLNVTLFGEARNANNSPEVYLSIGQKPF